VTDATATGTEALSAQVVAVALDGAHRFSKCRVDRITLIEGIGVEGDAHAGVTVRHRSRVKADPTQPNLRQVHLIHAELFDELAPLGFDIGPADLGENVTTRGVDLLSLSRGTILGLGRDARVEITGLRNPCHQIEAFRTGLLRSVLGRARDGQLIRKTGVMGIVRRGGPVRPGDGLAVLEAPRDHVRLEPV
jgi:MOSC domain-containing protein YiiM